MDKLENLVYFKEKLEWWKIFSSVRGSDDVVASKGRHSP